MTAPGVTLVPEEPDGLAPGGSHSAPPAREAAAAPAETPGPAQTPAPAETSAPAEAPAPQVPSAREDHPVGEADWVTEEILPSQEPQDTQGSLAPYDTPAPRDTVALQEPSAAEDRELELRGSLTVAKRVVEKIAEQAASEVSGTGEHQAAYAVRPGASATARPTVEVQLEGSDAWVSIDVGLTYPTPLRAAADELRAHLVERLEQLSGVTVRRLDIRISWLGDTARQPRRLQ